MPHLNGEQERKRVVLSTEDRKAAYHMLLGMSKDGQVDRGRMSVVASVFNVNCATISRLWSRVNLKKEAALDNQNDNMLYANNLTNCRKGKYKHDREAIKEAVLALPYSKRRKYRHLATNINLSLSTVYYLMKDQKSGGNGKSLFRKVSVSVKPTL
jgi:hypothetical protein